MSEREDCSTRAELLNSICDDIQTKHGSRGAISLDDLSETYHIGIEVPFAFQYLLTVNVLPLNIIMMLRGPQDACKTSLAIQIGKWIQQNDGSIFFVDAEHKFPRDIAKGLLGDEGVDPARLKLYQVSSAVEAQSAIAHAIKAVKAANRQIRQHNKEEPDHPWKEYCAVVILDSLPAALSDSELTKFDKEKYGDRTIAPYAHAWRMPIAALSTELADSNVLLIIINHERQAITNFGVTTPGGGQPKYQMSIDLRCSSEYKAAASDDPRHPDRNRKDISIEVRKNSGGARGRRIEDLVFRWDMHRNFQFELDEVSALLLLNYFDDEGVAQADLGPLKKLVHHRTLWSCKSLELKRCSASELMRAIETNEEIMNAIRSTFGIASRPVFSKTGS